MAIFPILKSEKKVQVQDKIRFWAKESFVTGEASEITRVEIRPFTEADFIEITHVDQSMWYLDWVYLTEGEKVVTLQVTDGEVTESIDVAINVVTAEEDCLFSTDADLRSHEHDIEQWIPEGYSSWNHVHRAAQKNILDWLDESRILKDDKTKWKPADLLHKEEARRLSTMIALRMIFGSISNQVDDIFKEKRDEYLSMEREARNRNYFTLDKDSDGEEDANERVDLRTMTLVRR